MQRWKELIRIVALYKLPTTQYSYYPPLTCRSRRTHTYIIMDVAVKRKNACVQPSVFLCECEYVCLLCSILFLCPLWGTLLIPYSTRLCTLEFYTKRVECVVFSVGKPSAFTTATKQPPLFSTTAISLNLL